MATIAARGARALSIGGGVLLTLLTVAGGGAAAPDDPVLVSTRNLQVLPKDARPAEILAVMKLVTRALGAECSVCHDSRGLDFASDAMVVKRRARDMMRMAAALRSGGVDWRRPPPDLCFDCHRGKLRPAPEPAR